MSRVYNFSAGPATLPEAVLKRAADEMLEYGDSGQSVMEMSHRSKEYQAIIDECEASLRKVMSIPDNYKVLFLQGGASSQFAMIPLNLMNKTGKADFVITGQWANKAYQEASKLCGAENCNVVASSKDKTFSYIPELDKSKFNPTADYFHICQNNTIYGTRWAELPDTGNVPLVADLSSCILSEPVDVSKYGMIYAGAQKNMGPAGLTVVIIREDLIGFEHCDIRRSRETFESLHRGFGIRQTAFFSLFKPVFGISVAVEQNAFAGADNIVKNPLKPVMKLLLREFFQLGGDLVERFRNDCVEHDVRSRAGLAGTGSAELEFVAGERKRTCAVAVRGVARQRRQSVNADLHGGRLTAASGFAVFKL